MNVGNALLIDYKEEFIRPEDRSYAFDDTMGWAYPETEHFESQLLFLNANLESASTVRKTTRAYSNVMQINSAELARSWRSAWSVFAASASSRAVDRQRSESNCDEREGEVWSGWC
jgi:hypothetical protein